MNTWVTSDTHFYHKNICKGSSRWPGGHEHDPKDRRDLGKSFRGRDYLNQYIMTDELIANINSQAKQNDLIRHGGDWSFGGIENIIKSRLRINCNNIILSLGNHDELIMKNRPIPLDLIEDVHVRFPNAIYLQDLFTEVTLKQFFRIGGIRSTLSHYAERIWNKSHHGAIQLHGHSHNGLENINEGGLHPVNKFYNLHRTTDVGVDNKFRLFGEYSMFHVDEIKKMMLLRKERLLMSDHHDAQTS